MIAVWWMACATMTTTAPEEPEPPALGTFRITPVDGATVAGAYRLEVGCAWPCRVELALDDGVMPHVVAYAPVATGHVLPVVGVHPERTIEATVTLFDAAGEPTVLDPLSFVSEPLDLVVPRVEILAQDGAMEPGWTLFPQSDAETWTFATGPQGEVVWGWFAAGATQGVKGLKLTAQGELWGLAGGQVVHADILGRLTARYGKPEDPFTTIAASAPFHHDVWPLDDGSFLALASENLDVPAYPVSLSDVRRFIPARIRSDAVVRYTSDGTPTARWSLADLLDTRRVGVGALSNKNRTHSNAVVAFEDQILVSVRHQDAIVSLDADSGALRWILGHPDGWEGPWAEARLTPTSGETTWPYHQHAPDVQRVDADRIRIVLFDNGNAARTSPYANTPHPDGDFSRVVEYVVDEAARTVSQGFAFVGDGKGDRLFAPILGNADYLPQTGHVIATYASLDTEGGVHNEDRGHGRRSTRVLEIDPTTGTAIWDARIYTTREEATLGWRTDRVQRLPSLYGDLATVRFR
ncbi:MAG: aryl-sulfate sulfotransferase [Myxococcota bacterium]